MTRTKQLQIVSAFILTTCFALHVSQANAQATRTWVSGVGDDANPCSRTAPCKTFAGAISKTAAGGEISVMDPGGYGAVTITKAISITNDGAGEAGILSAGSNGITVNAGAQDVVRIHGIIIDGGTGLNSPAGIRFNNGGELHVENCLIRSFQLSSAGYGIHFTPASPANLYVSDTVIVHNTNGTGGGGVHIAPASPGGVKAVLNRVQSYNNGFGLKVDGSTSSNKILVTVRDSVLATNVLHGIWAVSGAAEINIESDNNGIVNNQLDGVLADGAKAYVTLTASTLTANGNGVVSANGGNLYSFKNNNINFNLTSNGTIPAANILPQN
ncbi:MAG: hypothetical protein HZA66_13010 [Rhodopseudomonas palustris]|uniref:Right handed beta helix domain-containing protein n=1 Tax=Rhodopseudomonas palustris TaxID=1076 RepID=A0A933W1C9_RHOPL|nr:hypothetical protein [Rhodopseudomonas palustris]